MESCVKKYAEIPNNDVGANVENAWFESCREREVPFITVKSRTKLADVHWDYIAFPTEVDKTLESLGTKLRDDAIAIFKKYANKRSQYTANGHLVWYKNLEIQQAKCAAEDLYDLIVAYIHGANQAYHL